MIEILRKTKLLSILLTILVIISCQKESKYKFQTFENDPLKAQIYKLDNGLTVILSVYKDAPRIQTMIGVRTGSKNDPSDNTGLSHYLEHMMFKGTPNYGTTDYEKEKVYLEMVDSLFEVYRSESNEFRRKNIYKTIDSVSAIAATYAIANEYDKLIAAIGGKGSNAFTSEDETVYISDIPSNQLRNWAKIEFDRFENPIFRIFHTELESVYEEKNMSLDNDNDKMMETLYANLFKKHPYGQQSVLGTIEHLKNPSIKSLKKYFKERYVPNNMVISMSGDFEPDSAMAVITEYFGKLKSQAINDLPEIKEEPITEPIIKEVVGPDAEKVTIGFRFAGYKSEESDMLRIVDMILSNSTAGLIDLNLNQAQKVLSANCYPDIKNDYSVHVFTVAPKSNQKLEEAKDLILEQIELIKKGKFEDWIINAIINDFKFDMIKDYENNYSRAYVLANSFLKNSTWEYDLNRFDRLSKITKQQIIDFAKKYYNNNYVVVYKRTGEDKDVKKVNKPQITPISVNREVESEFYKQVVNSKITDIEPVFVDFKKDLEIIKLRNNINLLYKNNNENETFSMYYVFDMGSNNDKILPLAINYMKYLGTSKFKPFELSQEFYKIGCNFRVYRSSEQIWVNLEGLNENFEKGIALFESIFADAQPNQEALNNLITNILKKREDNKLSAQEILNNAMQNYGKFGPKNPYTNILSETELKNLKAEDLISKIKTLNSYIHQVYYYGSMEKKELKRLLNNYHDTPVILKAIPEPIKFEEKENNVNNVYLVDYNQKQVDIYMVSKSDKYVAENMPIIKLFNEYFGGSMASVVFQELRESKALAYNAWATYATPNLKEKSCYIYSYIGTQADKLPEAIKSMTDLFNNMPQSENSFNTAKDAVMKVTRTNRITKQDVIFNYEYLRKLGLDYDINKTIFETVPTLTFADLKAFQEKNLKNKKFNYLILGDIKKLDIKFLQQYGNVKQLTLEEIFGY